MGVWGKRGAQRPHGRALCCTASVRGVSRVCAGAEALSRPRTLILTIGAKRATLRSASFLNLIGGNKMPKKNKKNSQERLPDWFLFCVVDVGKEVRDLAGVRASAAVTGESEG